MVSGRCEGQSGRLFDEGGGRYLGKAGVLSLGEGVPCGLGVAPGLGGRRWQGGIAARVSEFPKWQLEAGGLDRVQEWGGVGTCEWQLDEWGGIV